MKYRNVVMVAAALVFFCGCDNSGCSSDSAEDRIDFADDEKRGSAGSRSSQPSGSGDRDDGAVRPDKPGRRGKEAPRAADGDGEKRGGEAAGGGKSAGAPGGKNGRDGDGTGDGGSSGGASGGKNGRDGDGTGDGGSSGGASGGKNGRDGGGTGGGDGSGSASGRSGDRAAGDGGNGGSGAGDGGENRPPHRGEGRGSGRKGAHKPPAGWLGPRGKKPPAPEKRRIWALLEEEIRRMTVARSVEFAPLGATGTSLKKAGQKLAFTGRCIITDEEGDRRAYSFDGEMAGNNYKVSIMRIRFSAE